MLIRSRQIWLTWCLRNGRSGQEDPSFWARLPAMPLAALSVVVVPVAVVVDVAGNLGFPFGHH